jgi:hypothetical protein
VRTSRAQRLRAVDEEFATIERLLKELRKRITDVAEEVRLAAHDAAGARRRVAARAFKTPVSSR